jgi:hypothetical protein
LTASLPPRLTGTTASPGTIAPEAMRFDQCSPGKAIVTFGRLATSVSG